MLSLPKWATVASTMALISLPQPKSVRTKIALPPMATIAATVSSPPAMLRSATATFAPSRAKARAVARPMPLAPPVTMATLSTNSLSIGEPLSVIWWSCDCPSIVEQIPQQLVFEGLAGDLVHIANDPALVHFAKHLGPVVPHVLGGDVGIEIAPWRGKDHPGDAPTGGRNELAGHRALGMNQVKRAGGDLVHPQLAVHPAAEFGAPQVCIHQL